MLNLERAKSVSDFWKRLPPTIDIMVGQKNGEEIDLAERPEILSYLPPFHDQTILDVPAGTGRFTGEFAKSAEKVVAVDLSLNFLQKNRETNEGSKNIEYICGDIMETSFQTAQFDLIFTSWLFMYLMDEEIEALVPRLAAWLKPKGHLFIRESCAIHRKQSKVENYFAIYRQIKEYPSYFSAFNLVREGSILAFQHLRADPLKCFWLYQLK